MEHNGLLNISENMKHLRYAASCISNNFRLKLLIAVNCVEREILFSAYLLGKIYYAKKNNKPSIKIYALNGKKEDLEKRSDKTYRLSSVFSMIKCHGYSRRLKCHCQVVVWVPRPLDPPLYETCRPAIRTTSRFYSKLVEDERKILWE